MELSSDIEDFVGSEVQQSEGNTKHIINDEEPTPASPSANCQGGDNSGQDTDIMDQTSSQTGKLTPRERMRRIKTKLFGKTHENKLKADVVNTQVPFYKLFMFADWWDYVLIVLGTIGACVHGVSVPIFFLFFGTLIDAFGANYANPQKMGQEVSKYALYLFYLGCVVLGASWLEISSWIQAGERQSSRIRTKFLEAVLRQEIAFFDHDGITSAIVNRVSTDTAFLQDAISEKGLRSIEHRKRWIPLLSVVSALSSHLRQTQLKRWNPPLMAGNYIHFMAKFIAGFVVAFCSVWQLSLTTLAVVPAIVIAGAAYALTMIGHETKSLAAYEEAGKVAQQVVAQVRTVYSFGGEAKAVQEYDKALQTTLKLGKQGGFAKGLGLGVTYGLTVGAWALLLWYSGILVRSGTTNGGKAFTTILNVIVGGIALGQAAPNLASFSRGKSAAYNILEMINRKPAIEQTTGRKLIHVNGQIEFQEVCFSYPSRIESVVLNDFNLIVPPGRTIALVGSSGSGKSTIVSLIERFYEPTSGKVLLDGRNIQRLHLKWLRQQIGLVNQEPALFATSIWENLLYGKGTASKEEVLAAATAANAHIFINQLPSGYDTQVGERGVQLSGGQRQRIAIARAMLKNPKILLLDEATSALDPGSQHIVQEALDRLMVGRTTLVVTHQLAAIRKADCIVVMHNGSMIEIGTHEELIGIGEKSTYAGWVKLQETGYFAHGGSFVPGFKQHSSIGEEFLSTTTLESKNNQINKLALEDIEPQECDATCKEDPALWRLLKLNSSEWHYGLLGIIGAIIAGCEFPLVALTIGQVLTTFYNPDKSYMEREVRKYTLIFTAAILVVIMGHLLQHFYFASMGETLTARIRKLMFLGILRNEMGWYDREESNSSVLALCLASDAASVRAAIADRICIVVQNISLVATAFVIAFFLQWRVACVMFATFPLLIASLVGENFFLKGFSGDVSKAYARASATVGEAVGNIHTVAAFCAEDKVVDLFNRELRIPQRNATFRAHIAGIGYGLSQFFMYGSYAVALWYASLLVEKREATFGDSIKIIMVLIFAAFGVAETIAMAPDFVKGDQALLSVFKILDRKTEIDPDDPKSEKLTEVRGDIEFHNVTFNYPMRPTVPIFTDLSIRVHAGTSLALVGESGSGKSTVISLIQRFYNPLSGIITIDGKNVMTLNVRSLREYLGVVQQEPALFASSIHDNIIYGKGGASESEVVEAAKTANAHNFISALPQGYQTSVGDRGVKLSGGQKQRVAIARAVIRSPAILLLDEATSALDAESEKLVQQALDRIMKGRTTVVIAHRLSTIRNADNIAMMKNGQILEFGTHNELMVLDGTYARFVHMQQFRCPTSLTFSLRDDPSLLN